MDLYADRLAMALTKARPAECHVEQFRPRESRPRLSIEVWQKMAKYYARYFRYPYDVSRVDADIYHIIDHSYGHLVRRLDWARTVVTCHDLILLKCRKGELRLSHSPRIATRMFTYSTKWVRRAARIIADSESTRRDVLRLLNVDPRDIYTVSPGVDRIFRRISDPGILRQVRMKYQLGEERNILHVGTCAPYKNISGLLQILAILQRDYRLECGLIRVGESLSQEQRKTARELGIEGRIHELGSVPLGDLVGVYNVAEMLLFPSTYEGFGWPPLEAMACGTPVVSSNAASLPEVLGNAGIMKDPEDYRGMAEAAHALLTSESLHGKLRESGLKRARMFTWERTAAEVYRIYQEVLTTYTRRCHYDAGRDRYSL